MQIKGYASTTSARLGDKVDFHVSVASGPADSYQVEIYRMGYYGGKLGRLIATSPTLTGVEQPPPTTDPATGAITCTWAQSWSWKVPATATTGYHLAVFTTSSGFRSYAPFVVRDQTYIGGAVVVMPFTTYQAYNQWPLDDVRGKSLYYGYLPDGSRVAAARARQVSFDRPYQGTGLPNLFDHDLSFISWVEQIGCNVNYATSIDIEAGTIAPASHLGYIFAGHDEYWSPTMRTWVGKAIAAGRNLAFLGANNIYWPIAFKPAADGTANRQIFCQKATPAGSDHMRWRDVAPAPHLPEQQLIGTQYLGALTDPVPLIVRISTHWLWAGCGVKDGDAIANVVGIEADGVDPGFAGITNAAQTLLSASPYLDTGGKPHTQATSVVTPNTGGFVFVAGSLTWTQALSGEDTADPRIQRATRNVIDRLFPGGRSTFTLRSVAKNTLRSVTKTGTR